MSYALKFGVMVTVGVASALSGASFVHAILKPNTEIPKLPLKKEWPETYEDTKVASFALYIAYIPTEFVPSILSFLNTFIIFERHIHIRSQIQFFYVYSICFLCWKPKKGS